MNKKLAKIPATLLGKKETVALKLKEEPYLIIIPKIFFDKAGISSSEVTFDLVLTNEALALVTKLHAVRREHPQVNEVST